jgi:hypothetical protein
MGKIPWIGYNELEVLLKNPAIIPDLINRPLREVLRLSGVDPDAVFAGLVGTVDLTNYYTKVQADARYAGISHQHAASDITSGLLALARGGTGLNASGAPNGSLLIGNGSGFTLAQLLAGAGVTITNAAGSITIAASGGSGGSTLIASLSAPASGIFEFTGLNLSAYKEIRIVGRGLSVNTDAGNSIWPGLLIQVGGSTWLSSYDVASYDATGPFLFANNGYATISFCSVANTLHALSQTATDLSEVELKILDPNSTGVRVARWDYSYKDAGGAAVYMHGHARFASASAITGLRFYTFKGGLTATNKFASGTVELYGIS